MTKQYPGWERLPGRAERFVNVSSGETLSRRQFDRSIGALYRSGFNSYESRDKSLHSAASHSPKSGGTATKYALAGVADANKAAQWILDKTAHKANAQFNFNVKIEPTPTKQRIDKRTGKPRAGKDTGWRATTPSGYASDISRHVAEILEMYEIDDDDIDEWEFNVYEED